jgi:hypothetical protein
MKSPIIANEAHRRSTSDQFLSMNRRGLKTSSYQASASGWSSTTWIKWKNSRIGMAGS